MLESNLDISNATPSATLCRNFAVLVFLALLTQFSFAGETLYKCVLANGAEVFTDRPCSANYTKINLDGGMVREEKKSQNKPVLSNRNITKRMIVGQWKRKGFIYTLRADGSLHAEKYIDGELVAWRSGTWHLANKKLSMNFTQRSKNYSNYVSADDAFMAGIVQWDKGNDAFYFRSDGNLKYFKKKAS